MRMWNDGDTIFADEGTNSANLYKNTELKSKTKPIWEAAENKHKCKVCGSRTVFSQHFTLEICNGCGRVFKETTLEEIGRLDIYDDARKNVSAKYYIPFHISESRMATEFDKWLSSVKRAPAGFKTVAKLKNVHRAYVPAFRISCDCDMILQETAFSIGRHGLIRESVLPCSIASKGKVSFEDVPLYITSSVDRELFEAVEPYSFDDIQPVGSDFDVSNIEVLPIDVTLASQGEHFIHRLNLGLQEKSREDHKAVFEEINVLVNASNYENFTFESLYFPVYIGEYVFDGKTYTVVMNGDTGEFAADLPDCGSREEAQKKFYVGLFNAITFAPIVASILYGLIYSVIVGIQSVSLFGASEALFLGVTSFLMSFLTWRFLGAVVLFFVLRFAFRFLLKLDVSGTRVKDAYGTQNYFVNGSFRQGEEEQRPGIAFVRSDDVLSERAIEKIERFRDAFRH